MAIVVNKNAGLISDTYEQCAICKALTLCWYIPKDVAICESCALISTHDKVPDKKTWIESVTGKKLPAGWTCSADRNNTKAHFDCA